MGGREAHAPMRPPHTSLGGRARTVRGHRTHQAGRKAAVEALDAALGPQRLQIVRGASERARGGRQALTQQCPGLTRVVASMVGYLRCTGSMASAIMALFTTSTAGCARTGGSGAPGIAVARERSVGRPRALRARHTHRGRWRASRACPPRRRRPARLAPAALLLRSRTTRPRAA